MPLLRPSNSDFLAFVKAAATSPAGGAVRSAASVGAPPVLGRGAAVRASYAGTKSSPTSSVVQLFGPAAASGPPPFVDVWLGKLAVVTTLASGFAFPIGVNGLPNGNAIVAEFSTHRIRVITPAGVVTTAAGSGTAGFDNGTGASATFRSPRGIAGLPNGNIVVGDTANHAIRLITSAGVVTTLAGDGTAAFADGTGSAAQFNSPHAVATFPNGDIVVADTYNHRIRLVTPAGVVTTLAGNGTSGSNNGTGAAASFSSPQGVAVLPNGNIVVGDTDNSSIRLITMPSKVVSTISSVGYFIPIAVGALPNGNIVVADVFNHAIKLITMPSGVVTVLAGSSAGGSGLIDDTGTAARFSYPWGMGVLANGSIVVGDRDSGRVRLITPT